MLSKLITFIGMIFMLSACSTKFAEDNNKIYKILTPQQWNEFQTLKTFKGSELDIKDGYLHISFKHQVDGTRQKFFANIPIVLITIDSTKLNPKLLKVEANKPGGDQYPHYYGALDIDMVIDAKTIE